MTIGGNNNNFNYMHSNNLSKQYQMQLGSFTNSRTGLIKNGSWNSAVAMGREASSVFRQARAAENDIVNRNELYQQASMMGLNVDVNQVAAMYDANGDGLLSGKELNKAENMLNNMYTQQMQNKMYNNSLNTQTSQAVGNSGGGGLDIGSTITGITKGLGQIFGSGASSEAGTSGGGDSGGGNFLSKAGDFIGKLFG